MKAKGSRGLKWLGKGAIWILYLLGVSVLASGTEQLWVPAGFEIQVYSDSVPDARSLALGADGTVYVGTRRAGKVYGLRDSDQDGKADQFFVLAEGLSMPNGVTVVGDALYVAEVHRIVRLPGIALRLENPPEPEVVFDRLPTDFHHGWKYLRQGPDGKLYTAVGAPCNVCRSEREIYATIVRMLPSGEGFEIYARGVRNSVGFDWHPLSGEMFFSEQGRDWMGENRPPEELNRAGQKGLNFGYPFCHGRSIREPAFPESPSCAEFSGPAWEFPAHVAPLGMRFYTGDQFPERYRNQLLIAHHGSWNRRKPQGYRVDLVRFVDGKPVSSSIFAEGWLDDQGKAWGRPVDILQLDDGSVLVSDDKRGAIYRISYRGPKS